MVSKQMPVDPMVRIWLIGKLLRKEKRLVIAIVVATLIAASVWVRMVAPSSTAWSSSELKNMSGLPLSPAGDAQPIPGVDGKDKAAFLQLQKDLSNQKKPDLVKPRSGATQPKSKGG